MRRKAIIWLAICLLSVTSGTQSITAATESNSIDLSTALQVMQKARNHSGYSSEQVEKCLFPYMATLFDNWEKIPTLIRRDMEGLFQRPDDPQSWWYKAGLPLTLKTPHFKFHYTVTGPDAVFSQDISPLNGVPDLVDVCAESYEKSYRIEVSQLGYKAPYDDLFMSDNGGDNRYDVYMFSGPWLGFTMPEFPVAVQSTAAMMAPYFGINSRMYEFLGDSEGKRYAETTCAHEFFHSVQFAYNYYMPRWFMEACCTWVERMVYDGSDQGETDANNYYNNQLTYWFRYPDWSLTKFDGWHEYGDVIWTIFLTEKYDVDIVKELYEDLSEGTYRELVNFYEPLISRGANLAVAFKEFTLWNYFTATRYDDRFYSHGYEYPPVSVHLDNIHREYPVSMELDSEQSPEHLGARYIRFLPASGQETISIRVNGSDITESDDRQSLNVWGTRGWGAKLVVYRKGRSPKTDEIFLFQGSQEGQRNFTGFGTDIEEIVLILSNLHPDLDIQSVSYSAGQQPSGKLSEPKISRVDGSSGIRVSWNLLDLSGIKEVAIVRKRYAPSEGDTEDLSILEDEVYSATDLNINGIPDGNLDVVGRVAATDTVFVDDTTFTDVNPDLLGFDPGSVRYYYAVVPVSEYGIMGTPAMSSIGITPSAPPPTVVLATQSRAPGRWQVSLTASQPLRGTPELVTITPEGERITVKLVKSAESDRIWYGQLSVNLFPPTGIYNYIVSVRAASGSVGTVITGGQSFSYVNDEDKQEVICGPNPFRPDDGKSLNFHPPGFRIKIFTAAGELVKELSDSEWDGTNEDHQPVASGIYVYMAEGDETVRTGKIAVIR